MRGKRRSLKMVQVRKSYSPATGRSLQKTAYKEGGLARAIKTASLQHVTRGGWVAGSYSEGVVKKKTLSSSGNRKDVRLSQSGSPKKRQTEGENEEAPPRGAWRRASERAVSCRAILWGKKVGGIC